MSSLYKLAQDGRIPCQKVGTYWRFWKEAIDRRLEQKAAVKSQTTKTVEKPTTFTSEM